MNNKFTSKLLNWYTLHPRELPWENDEDAYSIWLSEIIMQQTRVEYGSQYYLKFKKLFPTVFKLAKADLHEIMKAWEGLGYYSRARNLHKTAKFVANELGGEFPNTINDLEKLSGVGPYTATAIGSFAFKIPKAAIDGNAYRVLARYFGINTPIDVAKGKKEFQALGNELIDAKRPDDFNQAIMNFGALVCTPKRSDCENCPLSFDCVAYSANMVLEFPVKQNKTKVRKRYFAFAYITDGKHTYIQERTNKDVWRNLYQLPQVELKSLKNWEKELSRYIVNDLQIKEFDVVEKLEVEKQQLSHQTIFANCLVIQTKTLPELSNYKTIKLEEMNSFAFPKILNQILKKILT